MLIGLILVEAVVSMAEAAFMNLNENRLTKESEDGDKKAEVLLKYVKKPERYLHIVEVVLAGTSMGIGIFSAEAVIRFLLSTTRNLGFPWNLGIVRILGAVIIFFVILFVLILFGNLLPKKMGQKNSRKKAYVLVFVLNALRIILYPLLWILDKSVKAGMAVLGLKQEELEENVTEDEIMSIVKEGYEQGVLEDSEAEMINNIMDLDEKEVRDIMTHFKKIVAIDANTGFEEAIHFMLKESYSRFPLYEENIDNIIGILNLKDMADYYVSGKDRGIQIKELSREPYLVPDTQSIDLLLSEMQKRKTHMAIAIDEYGQTAGIVTLEDIVEEIIGNILDEYDVDEKMIIRQGKERFLIRGLARLDDISEELEVDLTHDDFETINGLMVYLMGHLPGPMERGTVLYRGWNFHVLDVRNKMIRFVRATKEKDMTA